MGVNNDRYESDFLGMKKIPNNAYYGVQTMRALENFPITGNTIDRHLIIALAMVKKSAAQANRDIGHLNEAVAEAIIQACEDIIDGRLHDQFIVDPVQGGAGTSSNMNANEVIANRALEILGEEKGNYTVISPVTHVNMSQSTNDVFPTASHIAVLMMLKKLQLAMDRLDDAFQQKVEEFFPILKIGRTHLQDAVPIRLGQEFEAYSYALKRDIRRIQVASKDLMFVNMGATAVGTGLNADPIYIEKVIVYLRKNSHLPLERAEHLVDATQNTDVYTSLSSALKVCMLNLSKVANDLRLMASGPKVGFNELKLPERQPGSSIMPGKVNPVMAEVVNQVAFQVSGNDHTICLASEAGQFELNVMEPVLVYHLMDSIKVMTNVLNVFTSYCVEGIQAQKKQLQANVDKSIGTMTSINPHIGYEQATEIAREAFETGKSIRDICQRKGLLTSEQLDKILNPYEMTEPGISAVELLKDTSNDQQ